MIRDDDCRDAVLCRLIRIVRVENSLQDDRRLREGLNPGEVVPVEMSTRKAAAARRALDSDVGEGKSRQPALSRVPRDCARRPEDCPR